MPTNKAIKTYQAWEDGPEISILDYLKLGDEVDEAMYLRFAEVVPPQYQSGHLLQAGEAEFKHLGRYHYMTFAGVDSHVPGAPTRYYYLGILPPFKQPKP